MIVYPEKFKDANPAGFDGIFDWDFLAPAFDGTKIMPMDIDAIVERKGKILIFETKSSGKEIPQGQKITLERLLKIGKGNIYVMIIYGKTPETITGLEEWYFNIDRIYKRPLENCDKNYVLRRVSSWFQWANSN